MSFDAHANLAYSTIATAPSPATSGTSLTAEAGKGADFPTAPFNALAWPKTQVPTKANAEIVRVTNKGTGDNWTISRAQEGTTAQSIDTTFAIAATATAKTFTDIETAIAAVQTALADKANSADLATVATTGAYSDLSGTPTIPSSIDDLSDVDTSTTAPTDGQTLSWNSTDNKWEPADGAAGGGGMTNPMTTQGDIIYGGASGAATRLAGSSTNYILTSNGPTSAPSWKPGQTEAIYYTSGQIYSIGQRATTNALTQLALTANKLYLYPYYVGQSTTINALQFSCSAGGAVGNRVEGALYTDNGAGRPDALICSAEFNCDSNGVKTTTLATNATLSGWIWMALVTASAVTSHAITSSGYPLFGLSAINGNSLIYSVASYGTTFDTTFPAGTTFSTTASSFPILGFQVA